MKRAILVTFSSTLVLLAAAPGIRPRADANSYPEHSDQADFSIGAALLPSEQAKKMFKLDLNHAGYIVIEIGVFPAPGKEVDLYPTDFTLSVGENAALRPISVDTIAEHVAGEPPRRRGPFDVSTSTGVYGRYPDPVTGRRTDGTVNGTKAGVESRSCRGSDCEPTAPLPPIPQPSPVETANAITQDLWKKSLPYGKTVHPVAGYLYFPKPPRKAKNTAWELRYENADGRIRLPLSR